MILLFLYIFLNFISDIYIYKYLFHISIPNIYSIYKYLYVRIKNYKFHKHISFKIEDVYNNLS